MGRGELNPDSLRKRAELERRLRAREVANSQPPEDTGIVDPTNESLREHVRKNPSSLAAPSLAGLLRADEPPKPAELPSRAPEDAQAPSAPVDEVVQGYLVATEQLSVYGPEDRQQADAHARSDEGIVFALPVIGDYRT